MNALQLVFEDLSTDHDERLRAIVDVLVETFLPRVSDQACLDVFELQAALATELAFNAGAVLKPESALHLAAILTDAVHAGATLEPEALAGEECVPEAGVLH